MEIVLATKNKHKIREIKQILKDLHVKILTLEDYPNMPEVIEDADTFEGNAIKKAKEVSKFTGKMALADDSGLMVDVLNGRPGVYSSRFAGDG
ncbi:non-canonical purine NTP pyrophosphatase, partial [bacterium]|nr:non-canonical purine NTP pyrophosphatase [bacterium]